MAERSGQFRVYRVTESVPHINLQAVDSATLYTVYQTGYGDLQARVDELVTGDLVTATLAGDPAAEEEPWRIQRLERAGGVEMGFAVDIQPPDVARETWTADATAPLSTVLSEDDTAVGACVVQPRDPLPDGAFVPSVLTGLLPLEEQLDSGGSTTVRGERRRDPTLTPTGCERPDRADRSDDRTVDTTLRGVGAISEAR